MSPIQKGQVVGYLRVRSEGQNLARQYEELTGLDRTFADKLSGKSMERPQLQAMLSYVREGDEVVCMSMDRLARSLSDLLHLVSGLTSRGVKVTFRKEALTVVSRSFCKSSTVDGSQ
jgi:DNA invertase Pin-like site-specific DNA recombinase